MAGPTNLIISENFGIGIFQDFRLMEMSILAYLIEKTSRSYKCTGIAVMRVTAQHVTVRVHAVNRLYWGSLILVCRSTRRRDIT
jgi:hypothetical protein